MPFGACGSQKFQRVKQQYVADQYPTVVSPSDGAREKNSRRLVGYQIVSLFCADAVSPSPLVGFSQKLLEILASHAQPKIFVVLRLRVPSIIIAFLLPVVPEQGDLR